ncbi:hypothetical protein BW42_02694 [Exiguobacterium sp. RIT341]|nr:hypothetical protein BW42_02694 [Exiguobacterium sp. RIT341]
MMEKAQVTDLSFFLQSEVKLIDKRKGGWYV